MDERLSRTAAAIAASGADWVVLTRNDSVAYATNHIPSVEIGSSPFAGGPTTALVSAAGICGVVAPNVEAGSAKASWAEFEFYEGYAYDHDFDPIENYLDAVESLARRLGTGGKTAIEKEAHPAALESIFEASPTADFHSEFCRVRATKTPAELQLLRRAGEAAAVGQRTFLTALRPGSSELELFSDARKSIENACGERVAVTGDFVSGVARTSSVSGWPLARRVEAGDPVICDLSPRVAGYWGDSCASVACRNPSKGFEKLFAASRTAIGRAAEIIRPGLKMSELDAELRGIVASHGYAYPHHSGHSLGTAPHEWPRVVPNETAAVEAGMVLAIEPGAYHPDAGGARLEWMFEVTATGCLVLTPFDFMQSV